MITTTLLLASAAVLFAALLLSRRSRALREAPATIMRQLQKRIAALQAELEVERMRVVACGAAATGLRTPESSPYWSPSHADVCKLADRVHAQARLLAALADGSCAPKDFSKTKGLHLPPS
jgi:hypothetical protein